MAYYPKIMKVCAQEILDSRGNPTIEASVMLEDGSGATAAVPSGASTGVHEALERRDGDVMRFGGKGVLQAVESINGEISDSLSGLPFTQHIVDARLRALDGTDDKSRLGANAILAVSMAVAKAAAQSMHIPLYRYIGGANAGRLPVPMMNVLNGGAHAANNLDVQEFMIMPIGAPNFSEALRWGAEIYHTLGRLLKADGKSVGVGDEGGFAPDLDSEEEAIDYLVRAIDGAGYSTDKVKIALDAAAGEWYSEGKYVMPKSVRVLSAEALSNMWGEMVEKYPIVSIEDGMDQDDFEGWRLLTEALGKKISLVGDDLFVTNTARLRQGIEAGIGNSILIKPNQIGTLSETMEVMRLANRAGYRCIVSHRSGETEDTTIADLAVGMNAGYIKTGAPCRSERVAKYNRLLRIEAQLSCSAEY